jgi:D-tyrosyl-tRNA(Tyr) deacylase
MRAVIQRVSSARVTVAGVVTGEIGRGLLVLLGVAQGDTETDGEWLARKIAALRIFEDDDGKMNRSVVDVAGGTLVVSQFTLLASTRKGTRPSFNDAAPPALAIALYEKFLGQMETVLGPTPALPAESGVEPSPATRVARGEFGARMDVTLVNDGPVTIIIDSKTRD